MGSISSLWNGFPIIMRIDRDGRIRLGITCRSMTVSLKSLERKVKRRDIIVKASIFDRNPLIKHCYV